MFRGRAKDGARATVGLGLVRVRVRVRVRARVRVRVRVRVNGAIAYPRVVGRRVIVERARVQATLV